MEPISLARDLENITKEGFLEKQSRYLKSWRRRWVVLTNNTLYSFKERKKYSSPTQVIPIRSITTIKAYEQGKQFSFKVTTSSRGFILEATNNVEKQQWISQIGKAIRLLTIKEVDAQ